MRTRSEMPPPELLPLERLRAEEDRLLSIVEGLGSSQPAILTHTSNPQIIPEEEVNFRTEKVTAKEKKKHKKDKAQVHFQRTMNAFFISENPPEDGKCSMVVPPFRAEDTDDDNPHYLVRFASPITDGARRAARALAGYTPLYKARSHPNLWQMQTKLVGAWVGTPYMGHVVFYGCQIPCVMFPSWHTPNVEYAVQTPDPQYRPYWEATIASWAVEHEQGNTDALVPWRDVDLEAPRPWWMPEWAMRVLRLEHELPPEHPDDPKHQAMLGYCRRIPKVSERRAPCTEAEWHGIPVAQSSVGDDEEGSSDAGSINDDVEFGLPTSSHWDPRTKKSTTPRGNEPHKHMDVVQAELKRNREYDARVARAQSGAGPSSARSGNRGRGSRGSRSRQPARAASAEPGPSTTSGPPAEPASNAPGDADTVMADPPPNPEASGSQMPPPVAQDPGSGGASGSGPSSAPSTSRQAVGTGPPRTFAPPPPNAPTIRSGYRSGPLAGPRTNDQARTRDQARGYTVEPQ
ncbi:hypothetical protein FRC11_001583 [Ceratobasidium sp. 423]|nr:hypothetical protein FRC11_001583 [Ceratobasidium sp. 423]